MVKTQGKSKDAGERTHSELQKEPPHDGSGRLPLYPFNGEPLDQVWIRLAIKGIEG